MTRQLQLPVTAEQVAMLHAGDELELSGTVLTGRDQACARIFAMLQEQQPLPLDPVGQLIYFVGPSPAPRGTSSALPVRRRVAGESFHSRAACGRLPRLYRKGISLSRSQERLRPASWSLFRRDRRHRCAICRNLLLKSRLSPSKSCLRGDANHVRRTLSRGCLERLPRWRPILRCAEGCGPRPMKIKCIEAIPLVRELDEAFIGGTYRITSRYTIVTRVELDNGIVGETFGGDETMYQMDICRIINEVYNPLLAGGDVTDVERHFDAMWNRKLDLDQRSIHMLDLAKHCARMQAIGTVDIALWDARQNAQAAGLQTLGWLSRQSTHHRDWRVCDEGKDGRRSRSGGCPLH